MSKNFKFSKLTSINISGKTSFEKTPEITFSQKNNMLPSSYFEAFDANSSFINYEDQANKIENLFLELLSLKKYGEIINICNMNTKFYTDLMSFTDFITLYRTAVEYNKYLKLYGELSECFRERFGVNETGNLFLKISKKEYIEKLKNRLANFDSNSINSSKIVQLLQNLKQNIEAKINKQIQNEIDFKYNDKMNKENLKDSLEFKPVKLVSDFVIEEQDSLGGASLKSEKYTYLLKQDCRKIASMLSSKEYSYKKAEAVIKQIGFNYTKQSSILKEFTLINAIKEDINNKAGIKVIKNKQ